MRQPFAILAGGIIAAALSACQTTASSDPVEALLLESSPEVTRVLSDAVSQAMGGSKVTLAPDVLTQSSKLVMDPKFVDDRSFQRPDHFKLMKDGASCYLLHEESGQKMPLGKVKCKAA